MAIVAPLVLTMRVSRIHTCIQRRVRPVPMDILTIRVIAQKTTGTGRARVGGVVKRGRSAHRRHRPVWSKQAAVVGQ